MIGFLQLLVFSLSLIDGVFAAHYFWYAKLNPSFDGLSHVYNMKAGNKTGLYAATQFFFRGTPGNVGYFGLQPQSQRGDMALFSFFGKNASTTHPNCKAGADGGDGVSCSLFFNWVEDRNYTLSMSLVTPATANATLFTWEGYIDDGLGFREQIGAWTVPANYLYYELAQFTEWYTMNGKTIPQNERPCMPKLDFEFYPPTFYKNGIADHTLYLKYHDSAVMKDKCVYAAQASGIANATQEVLYDLGGGRYRIVLGQYTPDSDGYYYALPPAGSSSLTPHSSVLSTKFLLGSSSSISLKALTTSNNIRLPSSIVSLTSSTEITPAMASSSIQDFSVPSFTSYTTLTTSKVVSITSMTSSLVPSAQMFSRISSSSSTTSQSSAQALAQYFQDVLHFLESFFHS